MKTLASILLSFSLLVQNVTVSRNGSQRPTEADPRYFTGSVRVEMVLLASEPSRLSGARVTFEPGARTAWDTHPAPKHWHGATTTSRMSHIALHEHLNGNVVTWMEKVSDEQYKPR